MTYNAMDIRFKGYEKPTDVYLTTRIPLIIRVDGQHFSNYTRHLEKPFDIPFMHVMDNVAMALCKEIAGAQLAYTQSDEISILIHNYKKLTSQPWVGNRLQKLTSLTAALASAIMTAESLDIFGEIRPATFDSRAFVLPEAEVCNYFWWRQKDCTKNSIQVVAQSMYSQKQLHLKNTDQLQEMIFQKDVNWNNLPTELKRGRCIIRKTDRSENQIRSSWVVDREIPIFSSDRDYIEKYLRVEEE